MKKLFIISCLLFICAYIQAQWTNIQIEPGMSPKNDIISICFDKQGTMWVATSYGVYKEENGQWRPQGVEDIYAQTLYIGRDETAWAGVWGGGVFRYKQGETWENVKEASVSISTNAIVETGKDHLWIGTWDKGLLMYDGKKWINYKAAEVPIGDNSILSLAADDSKIWIGTYHGLSSFDGKNWKLYNRDSSPLPDNDIYSLHAGKNGLWIGTCNGLAFLQKGNWTAYPKGKNGISGDVILSVKEDIKGNVWVGTNKGLTVFNDTKWKTYTMENSNLLENRIQTITIHDNKIYIGTSLGISMLNLSEFAY